MPTQYQDRRGNAVQIGQRWKHRKNARVVSVVGFMRDGWSVCYRTADDPKSNRLSTSLIYQFTHNYQRIADAVQPETPVESCGAMEDQGKTL